MTEEINSQVCKYIGKDSKYCYFETYMGMIFGFAIEECKRK